MTNLAGLVSSARAAAAMLQTDTCTITRPGAGEGVFDTETGTTTEPEPIVVYEGPCRLRQPSMVDRTATAGEHTWTMQDTVLSLPIDVTGLRVDVDQATITSSQFDPDLPGTVHTVKFVLRGSQTSARRVVVRQVSA